MIKTVMDGVKEALESTYTNNVKSKVGDYAGLYDYGDSYLVSSMDGVGTKLFLASHPHEHHVIGADLVSHCINDILVINARPLFFLNYFGYSGDNGKISQPHVTAGMASMARKVSMPIISGETACMEGLYPGPVGNYELVGTIIGQVKKYEIIDGSAVQPTDVVIGLRSWGLHTNGYTILRKLFWQKPAVPDPKWDYCPELKMGIRDAGLRPHRCYYKIIRSLKDCLRGTPINAMAHITGGGLETNLKRVLKGHTVQIKWDAWEEPPIFGVIRKYGDLSQEEMRAEFNLGIGYVVVVAEHEHVGVWNYLRTMGEEPVILGYVE